MSAAVLPPKANLKARHAVPYGGMFVLNDTQNGLVGSATAFDGLLRAVREWRKANGLQNGLGLEDMVEQAVCAKYPQECEQVSPLLPNRRKVFSFGEVIQGTRVMVTHKLAGSPLVSDEEANRRAAICAGCPNNISFQMPCGGRCGELETVVNAIIGSRKTKHDGELRQCAICRCYLSAAVYVPLDIQWKVLTNEQKAQFQHAAETISCWKYVPEQP